MITSSMIQAIIRHLLTTVGGGFLTSWGLSGSEMDAAVGAVATLAGVVWSLREKRKAEKVALTG